MGEKDHSDRLLSGEGGLSYVPRDAIDAVRAASSDSVVRAELLADVCRINTLYMIMQAGSGHIGSSFSSTDLITWLWTEALDDPNSGREGSDVYFSSKGHDAPAPHGERRRLQRRHRVSRLARVGVHDRRDARRRRRLDSQIGIDGRKRSFR